MSICDDRAPVARRRPTRNLPIRGTVLTIFEQPETMHTLEANLTSKGFELLRARHAMHGVWLAMTRQPHVILTDQIRPLDEADYLLECLQRNPKTATIPVVAMVDALRQQSPSVSRLREVSACYLRTSPVEQLIAELDQQIARPREDREPSLKEIANRDGSRHDAFFAELGHTTAKQPSAAAELLKPDVLEPPAAWFPASYTVDRPHKKLRAPASLITPLKVDARLP